MVNMRDVSLQFAKVLRVGIPVKLQVKRLQCVFTTGGVCVTATL